MGVIKLKQQAIADRSEKQNNTFFVWVSRISLAISPKESHRPQCFVCSAEEVLKCLSEHFAHEESTVLQRAWAVNVEKVKEIAGKRRFKAQRTLELLETWNSSSI